MCCVYFCWCTVCVYMSMWVIIADQSVYYTRLYTTCWLLSVILGRCDGAGDTTVAEKLGTLLLGHNSSWLVWMGLKRIWQVIQILKKNILTSLYAMFSRSSASQTLVKETNYDQFIISKDVMDKSVSNQRGTSCPNVLKIWHVIWCLVGGQEQMHYWQDTGEEIRQAAFITLALGMGHLLAAASCWAHLLKISII